MSCWCGHGAWHHHVYPYPPPYLPPYASPGSHPPPRERHQAPHPPHHPAGPDELQDYLRQLEAEAARVRRELEDMRAEASEP